MRNLLKNNKYEVAIISLFSLAYLIFCNYLMVELPYLTWFDQFHLIEGYYNKSLTFSQLMTTYGEQGLFGYNILFLINLIVFKLTTFFDVYVNDINVALTGILCIYAAKESFSGLSEKLFKVCALLICVFEFNFMQLSSGAMETQVRLGILFFIITAIMIDKVFTKDVTTKHFVLTIIMIFFGINVFGTFYSFAGIPIIFLIMILNIIKNRKIDKHQLTISFAYVLSVIIYFLQYSLNGKGSVEAGGLMEAAVGVMTDPISTFTSLIAYDASTVLGYPVYIDKVFPDTLYLLIGIIITAIYIFSLICFFKAQMYKKTVLPVMLMGYSIMLPCSETQNQKNKLYYMHE